MQTFTNHTKKLILKEEEEKRDEEEEVQHQICIIEGVMP